MTSERGVAAAYRARSLESRATGVLSVAVMGTLTLALLAWYYGAALRRPARAAESARAQAASRAQSEMPLPPLPVVPAQPPAADAGARPSDGAQALPIVAETAPLLAVVHPQRAGAISPVRTPAPAAGPASAGRKALERRLAGPAFARQSDPSSAVSGAPSSAGMAPAVAAADGSAAPVPAALARLLAPVSTPAVAAQVLPTERLLLPKGAFIDCTLETAIDSTLPGMTTCITATDTFGADGQVVLIERGSKLVGETRGEVQQGSARVFVLWTEARTPSGVVIPLASPGTDELGRAGLPGAVSRHFLQRFGAALLISIIDGGAQIAAQSGGGTVVVSPTASQDVASEVLRDTLRIPPTVVKHQGDRIQVLVARDIDFRPVYELRVETGRR